jgi:DNA-binding XRE family transcriptional regulator
MSRVEKNRRVSVVNDRVTLTRKDYERLLAKAGEQPGGDIEGPALPEPDSDGNLPAVEFMRVSIARDLIRRRRAAGLTQMELADKSGVRQETISRIESGKHTVTEAVMNQLERALARPRARRTATSPKRR